jgi:hypothetical protein
VIRGASVVQKGYRLARWRALPQGFAAEPDKQPRPHANLDGADQTRKRIAQRNYWLEVATHWVRRTELVVVVLVSPVWMVVSGNQGGAKPFLVVYRRSK